MKMSTLGFLFAEIFFFFRLSISSWFGLGRLDTPRNLPISSTLLNLLAYNCSFLACLAAQSYPTLCNSMDCSPPDSSVHEVLQARILEWVAIPFSRGFPNPNIEPRSPVLQADSLPSESHSLMVFFYSLWYLVSSPVSFLTLFICALFSWWT